MRVGDRVRISGAKGTVEGRVDRLVTLDELVDLPGFDTDRAREILREGSVELMAVLSYNFRLKSGRVEPVAFVAFMTREGRWVDLRAQVITVERIGGVQPSQAALFDCSPRPR